MVSPAGLGSCLLEARTFWQQCVAFFMISVCSVCVCLAMLWRRRYGWPRALDSEGSSSVVDTVMTLPFFVLVAFLAVQTALLARASFVVHYAAYSAARAARMVAWTPLPSEVIESALPTSLQNNTFTDEVYLRVVYGIRSDEAQQAGFRAACRALTPLGSAQNVTVISAEGDAIARAVTELGQPVSSDGIARKATYACDENNTQLSVAPVWAIPLQLGGRHSPAYARPDSLPIESHLSFAYGLDLPVGVILGSRRPDGTFFRSLSADVTVM